MFGSKEWRKSLLQATVSDQSQNWHDLFTFIIIRDYPHKTVEANTAVFIKNLQTDGYAVFGLTARERNKWYDTPLPSIDQITLKQIEGVDIRFTEIESPLTNDSEHFRGIFFADVEPKGGYILKIFKNVTDLPPKVIFVDDKESQVRSVSEALCRLNIDHECYWYTATEADAKTFDPLLANIQLYYFWISEGKVVITNDEAALIAQRHPEKTADDYLQAVIQQIKDHSTSCNSLMQKNK